MEIRKYQKDQDEAGLMKMIRDEGEDWYCYWADEVNEMYRQALENSITYVAYEGGEICGYSRSINDNGFYIYVCDLLVRKSCRGVGIGKSLMESIYSDYPPMTVYVMSDVDGYYDTLGYRREGSVFEVSRPE
ncbi:GNAT family N-acetyltransferase [Gudongella sp. DL1XJH-153]|uniref:GNAT family N-acetyltransferase n=1 Tax=Gudongella sp. DL1XJH-153 TaxID=3409804 RepID=UPI003BB6BABF